MRSPSRPCQIANLLKQHNKSGSNTIHVHRHDIFQLYAYDIFQLSWYDIFQLYRYDIFHLYRYDIFHLYAYIPGL